VNLGILIGRFPPGVYGGAEIQAEQWARRLADRHHVTVVTRRENASDPPRTTRDGFAIVRLPRSEVPLVRTWLDLGRIEEAVVALPARPNLLLAFQTFISGYAAVRIQRRHGIPAVVWVRGEDEYRLTSPRTSRISLPVWDAAAGVLVQSEANREHVLEAVRRFRPAAAERIAAKMEVVPNGIELPPSGSGPTGASSGRILSVGRLIRDKGMDVVIDAVAGMQGLLTIAGDGPERAQLEARARHHQLDVRFEGAVPRERLAQLYEEAQCVVLASRRGEGLPNVLLEAFAHGRAVVATPVNGVRDLVRDRVNGLLVPAGDPVALRDALARLAHERGLAGRLGAAGRVAVEPYTWDHVRERLEACLTRWASA
jgi:glycosyltransferase involved in cell wall biosynthesis